MNSVYSDMRKEYLDEWRLWYRMHYVCEHNHHYYVETSVCEEWQGEQGFINWFDHVGPRPGPEYVFDRINKLDDYRPGNVEWTLKSVSGRRQRRHLDKNEMSYWVEKGRQNGIKGDTVRRRINEYHWTPEEASTVKPQSGTRYAYRRV